MLHPTRIAEESDFQMDGRLIRALSRFDLGDLSQEAAFNFLRITTQWGNFRTFVTLDSNGEIVSTATGYWIPTPLHGGKPIGFLEFVATIREEEGHAYGKAVVKACEDYLFSEGCYRVCLYCSQDNLNYYKGQGYREWQHSMRKDAPHEDP